MASLDSTSALWGAAVATFGIGDILTTHYGLQRAGVEEAHPLSETILAGSGTPGMVGVKAVVFGVALYAAREIAPDEWAIGIPLGLALLGTGIVGNNVSVLARS